MRFLLLLLLLAVVATDAYKILVYNPRFSHSHSNFMGRIADVLAEAGHNVSSLVSEINTDIEDGTKLSRIIRVRPSEATAAAGAEMNKGQPDMFEMSVFNLIGAYMMGRGFGGLLATQCKALLAEPGHVEQLKAENYDVFFTEHFDMCGVGLSEVIKPRSLMSVAASAAFGPQLEEFGIPSSISYNPASYISRLNVHSMWDRLVNIYVDFLSRLTFGQMRTTIHAIYAEKYGKSFPSMEQISSNSAYVFTNEEPLIDFAHATISKVIPIGGIGAKEPKKLCEEYFSLDWEKILSKRDKAVLLSFGSVAKSAFLPEKIKNSIVETVRAFPHVTFIWKYEEEDAFARDIASKIPNLELTNWMPQVDLLAHPNLSAFITHGGMGSTMETALRGVPGIFIPIFGDQPRNAGMMEHNGLGKVLDKSDVPNSAKFIAAIREVLENESYRSNSKRVSAMLHKRPFTAREQLIKYTEFAAEFGTSKALRPQSHDMNWIELNNVDIIFVGVSLAVILVMFALKLLQILARILSSNSKSKKE